MRILNPIETAAPKAADAYQWFTYTGSRGIPVAGRTPITISKGMVFGVRPSSNGKLIRLVLENQETKVYTIDMATAKQLAKYCLPKNASKKAAPKPATAPKADAVNIDKLLDAWWPLYKRYRTKFPATSESHIKVFTQLRDWSHIKVAGTTKLYRGTSLRDGDYKVGAKVDLTHARGLVSFTGTLAEAKRFAQNNGKIGKASTGVTYVLVSDIANSNILVSVAVMNAVAKKLRSLGMNDDAESFETEAYDLARHENEAFVLVSDIKATVLQRYGK